MRGRRTTSLSRSSPVGHHAVFVLVQDRVALRRVVLDSEGYMAAQRDTQEPRDQVGFLRGAESQL
jgi:hypothetical protein